MASAYLQPVEFTLDYTLGDGHWPLDAMFGCDRHEPPHLWLALKVERPPLVESDLALQ